MESYGRRKIAVVYYLCRNRHLEHPHFIEVPLSSPEGLYLRDVINRLNLVRGKVMPTRYSWSCKRSYKNGFVWHDLSEDDLVLPANGDEYVLKGSELLDQSPSDRIHQNNGSQKQQNPNQESPNFPRAKEASCSSYSPPTVVIREAKPPLSPPSQEEEVSPIPRRPPSSDICSPGLVEYRVCNPIGAADASTQTEDGGGRRSLHGQESCTRGVSTDDGLSYVEFIELQQNHARKSDERTNNSWEGISPPPTLSALSAGRKSETLESLIRSEACKMNSYRILHGEDVLIPKDPKLRPSDVLMQLITCGSISVKDHHRFGFVPSYKPRFSHMKFPSPIFSHSMMLGELDCLSEDPRLMRLKLEDKEYFSGSLIETKKYREDIGKKIPILRRSSSYNADRSCKSLDSRRNDEETTNTSRSKCLPRTIKLTSIKPTKNESTKSPISDCPRRSSAGPDSTLPSKGGSRSITDASSLKGSSMRLESFREEKEKTIKIEESLRQEHGL
ncbi:protein SOSEKI 3-like isoform X1 [Typha angustifolia]|uniref:protein SOSEKI 3-like isoform X1 n=2 Tax=Typha angustifolia TaxID=59011 RepID=UPI003C2B15B2